MHGVERRLPAAAEDGVGGIAIDRRADRRTGQGDGQSAPPAPRCRSAAGGSARSGSGLSTTDHCRSRFHCSDLSLREMSLLVGWCLPGRRRERRRKLQPSLSEGQPSHAALTQSGCERRSQNQRKHLRDRVSPLGPAPGTQSGHWDHCPSTVSADLVDPAPGSPLRRTGPSRYQTIEAEAHCENDQPTPKTRLSDRAAESSTPQSSTRAVIFDPVGPKPAPKAADTAFPKVGTTRRSKRARSILSIALLRKRNARQISKR